MSTLLAAAQTLADHAQAFADHADIWAAPEPTGTPQHTGELNTDGILGFLIKNVASIIIGCVGAFLITKAFRGKVSETFSTSLIVFIGVSMLAGAGSLYLVGDKIFGVLFK